MRLPWVLFGLLLAMCAAVAATFFIPERPVAEVDGRIVHEGHGVTHPDFGTMLIGGPGQDRHGHILWLGWAFGFLQVLFFMTCLAFGASKKGRLGPLGLPLLLGGAVFAAIFTAMILSYRNYMTAEDLTLVFAFPKPTAWMIYGMWIFPVFFMVTYLVYFDRWVMTEGDLDSFRRLVDERTAQARKAP